MFSSSSFGWGGGHPYITMIVKNPTDAAIEVMIDGTVYRVEAGESLPRVRDAHAEHWKNNIHNFIVLEPEVAAAPKVVVPKEESKAPAPEVKVVPPAPPAPKETPKK